MFIHLCFIHTCGFRHRCYSTSKQTNKQTGKQTNKQPTMHVYVHIYVYACMLYVQPFACKINTSMVCQRFKQTQALFPCSERV